MWVALGSNEPAKQRIKPRKATLSPAVRLSRALEFRRLRGRQLAGTAAAQHCLSLALCEGVTGSELAASVRSR